MRRILLAMLLCALLTAAAGCRSESEPSDALILTPESIHPTVEPVEPAAPPEQETNPGEDGTADTAEKETMSVPEEKTPDAEPEPVQSEPETPSEPSPPPPASQDPPVERSEPAPPQPPSQPPSQPPVPVTPEPAAPEPEPVKPVPAEPEPEEPAPSEPEPTEPAFDIDYWISYAKSYASGIGLNLNSEAVYCWDNPIIAGSGSKYLERDIQGMLNKYSRDEEITDVWVWATPRADGNYDLFIGYA